MEHKTLLHTVLEPAIKAWFRSQCADLFSEYYLFVREARHGETLAIPVIAKKPPSPDYYKAMTEPLSNVWTPAKATEECYKALASL